MNFGFGAWGNLVVFLAVAALIIPILTRLLVNAVSVRYSSTAVQQLFKSIFRGLAWFFVLLVSLNIVGLGGLANSLGTATGFVALGVAYAVRDMIADTVAGVYLAGDEDFSIGQTVEVDGKIGEVVEVGLRNSKLQTDDGVQVLSNSKIDQEWKRLAEE